MKDYVTCMEANSKNLSREGHELEVILVNDCPDEGPEIDPSARALVRVVTNPENKGIHYSRVAGLKEAGGTFIMFLDQDDLLEVNALLKLVKEMEKSPADLIISNAKLEQADGHYLQWYRTDYHWQKSWDMETYINVGIQIISPGQCLIKKSSIPEFWMDNIVSVNGADDYYLWLLMLAAGAKASTYREELYIHKYTGVNISSETSATDASVYDFLNLLYDCDYFKKDDIIKLHEMITYKAQFRTSGFLGKVGASLANLGIFIANLKFKKNTKTEYGFNR